MLEGDPSDLVYVNSLASSVFAFAAKLTKRKSLVHVHEKIGEMRNLLGGDATKLETMRVADAALLAADDIADDLIDMYGGLPPEVETFGIAVEIDAIRRAAAEAPAAPPPQCARRAADARRPARGRHVRPRLGTQGRRHLPRSRVEAAGLRLPVDRRLGRGGGAGQSGL